MSERLQFKVVHRTETLGKWDVDLPGEVWARWRPAFPFAFDERHHAIQFATWLAMGSGQPAEVVICNRDGTEARRFHCRGYKTRDASHAE